MRKRDDTPDTSDNASERETLGGDTPSAPTEYTELEQGTRLGPYQIDSLIGQGGMGEVYLARDTRLRREVAIKILPGRRARDPGRLARFEREARAVAALSHPNILAIYDVGNKGPVTYAVMEYLHGESLKERLIRGPVDVPQAMRFAVQMASGLAAAHAKGVIHRDLKPDNVFVTEDGTIKILDFGLAKIDHDVGSSDDPSSHRTEVGVRLGTLGYMAPEQLRGIFVDHRADIFAFGVTLYEMLTGRRAFPRSSSTSAVLDEEPPRITSLNPAVPVDLEHIATRCMARNPADRFQSVNDLLSALEVTRSGSGIVSAEASAITAAAGGKPSIAVLPFADMSPGKDLEYFCDGIAEEILNALTKSGELRVVARTSAFQYKGQSGDVRRFGADLRVQHVLEGSVRAAGDRLRVTVKLVAVEDGIQLWSENYDRTLDDVFVIQDEIASKIAESLKLTLLEHRSPPAQRRPHADAYHAYLKARFHLNKRTESSLRRAVDYSEVAIALDESFAPAHACLADGLILLGFQGVVSPPEVMPKARAAARRALALDESLAEAHVSLGCVLSTYESDWEGSDREFQRALELNIGSAPAHYWCAIWNLIPRRRFDEAERRVQIARELDPLSLVVNAGMGWLYFFARRFEDTLKETAKALEIDEGFVMAHDVAAQAYVQLGRYSEAIEAARRAVELSGERSLSLGTLGHARAVSGKRAAAREVLDELLRQSEHRYVSSYDIALVHAGLGEIDAALDRLERAFRERNGWLVFLGVDSRFDELRESERFAALVCNMGLDDEAS